MKTFNQKVKKMYKRNCKKYQEDYIDIHIMKDQDWVEYTDGIVLVRSKGESFFDEREAAIKNCPTIGKKDKTYPDTDRLFPKTPIKARVKFQKKALIRLLECFENDDLISFFIRDNNKPVLFSNRNGIYGLIMSYK